MNTNMTGKGGFQTYLRSCALDESRLGIVRFDYPSATREGFCDLPVVHLPNINM